MEDVIGRALAGIMEMQFFNAVPRKTVLVFSSGIAIDIIFITASR